MDDDAGRSPGHALPRVLIALIALSITSLAPSASSADGPRQRDGAETRETIAPLALGIRHEVGVNKAFAAALDQVLAASPRIAASALDEVALSGATLSPPDVEEKRLTRARVMRARSLESVMVFTPHAGGVLVTVVGPDGEILSRFVQPTPARRAFGARDARAALAEAFTALVPAVDAFRARSPDGRMKQGDQSTLSEPSDTTTSDAPGGGPGGKGIDPALAATGRGAGAPAVEQGVPFYDQKPPKAPFGVAGGIWTGFLSATEVIDNGYLPETVTTRQPGRGLSLNLTHITTAYPATDFDIGLRLQPTGDNTTFNVVGEWLYTGAWQIKGRLGWELDMAFRIRSWPEEQFTIINPLALGPGLRFLVSERFLVRASLQGMLLTSPSRGFGAGWMVGGRLRWRVSERVFLDARPSFARHSITESPGGDKSSLRVLEVPFQLGYQW